MERTSFRSATHATDSTWVGWTAKRAATKALRQVAPVIRRKTRNTSTAFAAWNSTFTTWWAPGFTPKSSTSSMCESQVSGCQLETWSVVKAQVTPCQVRPACTVGFSVT